MLILHGQQNLHFPVNDDPLICFRCKFEMKNTIQTLNSCALKDRKTITRHFRLAIRLYIKMIIAVMLMLVYKIHNEVTSTIRYLHRGQSVLR